MASFTYYAKRQIKAGHSIGIGYTITVDLRAQDGLLTQGVKNTNVSLNGNVVTVLHRIEKSYSIATVALPISGGTYDFDDFEEFFSSVAGGETFVFNDGSDQNAILSSDPSVTREEGLYFSYRFGIRLL